MPNASVEKHKWTLASCFAITLLCLYPQSVMWVVRGDEWNGAYAQVNGDEWLYSAYIQALIDGRPRRSDPYTGRDDEPRTPQPESVFSIQFVPAYLIAMPARLLGISASTAFIAVDILIPLLFCLSLAWLIRSVTGIGKKIAAAAAPFTVCFGGLAGGVGLISLWSGSGQYYFLPFMRRYEPAAMIPVFFLFCGFTWRALRANGWRAFMWALSAGLALMLLIFSYLYLWTTALAWLTCLGTLWLLAARKNRKPLTIVFPTIILVCAFALIPYLLLLLQRSTTLDSDQKLTSSHAPDLFRMPELIGTLAILIIFLVCSRRRINWRQPEMLMTLSFLIAPFLVFNQQIITGKSLQPFHFQMYIANYVVLVGVAIGALLIYQSADGNYKSSKALSWILIISFWWGAIEVLIHTKTIITESKFIDSAVGVCQHLRKLSENDTPRISNKNPRPLVLTTDYQVSIILPTFTPQAVLWSPNFDFLNISPDERRDRLYKFLYFSGFNGEKFRTALGRPMSTLAAVTFGHERVLPDLAVNTTPISADEINAKVADYEQYCLAFTRETASNHPLSYVVVPSSGSELGNLDRWYERDDGDRIDEWVLYKVRLRP